MALAVGLLAILAAETLIRYRIELPALERLERIADARAVERLRAAYARRVGDLERFVWDYAAWDVTYRFMQLDPSHPEAVYFRESEVGWSAHENNRVNGIIIADRGNRVRLATHFDLASGQPAAEALDAAALLRELSGGAGNKPWQGIRSGIIRTSLGPVLFAAGPVTDTEGTKAARGTLLVWRRLDADVVARLTALTGIRFELIPVADARGQPALAGALSSLAELKASFLPRDANNDLYWLLNDTFGQPAYIVRQPADARAFTDELFSPSFVAGFASSALILLLLAVYFSQAFVRPVTRATAILRRWRHFGQYDCTIDSPPGRRDELTELFQHFNDLIGRVREQEADLREQNRRLAELSQQDSLTGIPNRRFLTETLDRFWRQAVRAKRPISVLMVDVDYFKPFNDRYGHQVGDRVLRQVAQALQENLHRATDFVARYGGEEFCVLLTDTGADDARRVAEGLRAAVKALGIRHAASRCSDVVTVSIGIASAEPDRSVVHLDIVKEADRALYNAKAAGRDCVCVAEPIVAAAEQP